MADAETNEVPAAETTPIGKLSYLHQRHVDFLRWRAYARGVNQSETVREALDLLMEREAIEIPDGGRAA